KTPGSANALVDLWAEDFNTFSNADTFAAATNWLSSDQRIRRWGATCYCAFKRKALRQAGLLEGNETIAEVLMLENNMDTRELYVKATKLLLEGVVDSWLVESNELGVVKKGALGVGRNGVAVLIRRGLFEVDEADEVEYRFDGWTAVEMEGRFLAVRFGNVVIVALYFPSAYTRGDRPLKESRVPYKMQFTGAALEKLRDYERRGLT
ncbi:hypothetical protein HDU79_002434, partial [Rhizoclosmatium sp. JEL0117]